MDSFLRVSFVGFFLYLCFSYANNHFSRDHIIYTVSYFRCAVKKRNMMKCTFTLSLRLQYKKVMNVKYTCFWFGLFSWEGKQLLYKGVTTDFRSSAFARTVRMTLWFGSVIFHLFSSQTSFSLWFWLWLLKSLLSIVLRWATRVMFGAFNNPGAIIKITVITRLAGVWPSDGLRHEINSSPLWSDPASASGGRCLVVSQEFCNTTVKVFCCCFFLTSTDQL